MNRTKIEWCKNPDGTQGYTWNPITGCLYGCTYCWARGLANGRLKSRMLENTTLGALGGKYFTPIEALLDPFYPRLWQDRLAPLFPYRSSKGIFVCSMGELFGPWLPEHWTRYVLEKCKLNPQHRFYLLTKQPQELAKWSPFPDNCWVGVSVTNLQMAEDACQAFAQIEAPVKYVSFEPLIEPVPCKHLMGLIDWAIIGAQTKPNIMPEYEWVRNIVNAAEARSLPVFLKDSLTNILGTNPTGKWLRQEMPK